MRAYRGAAHAVHLTTSTAACRRRMPWPLCLLLLLLEEVVSGEVCAAAGWSSSRVHSVQPGIWRSHQSVVVGFGGLRQAEARRHGTGCCCTHCCCCYCSVKLGVGGMPAGSFTSPAGICLPGSRPLSLACADVSSAAAATSSSTRPAGRAIDGSASCCSWMQSR